MCDDLSYSRIGRPTAGGYALRMKLTLNIRRLREAKGLTLKELGAMANVSATHVSEVERGLKNLNNHLMERFAAALDVTPEDLISGGAASDVQDLAKVYKQLENVEDRKRVKDFALALLRSQAEPGQDE